MRPYRRQSSRRFFVFTHEEMKCRQYIRNETSARPSFSLVAYEQPLDTRKSHARARMCMDLYTQCFHSQLYGWTRYAQLPDTRVSSRCGIAREGKMITCTHARNRSRATARGECKSNDVGPQGMTNNTLLPLFLSLLSSYIRDIRPSQFITKHCRLPKTKRLEQMSGKIVLKFYSYFAPQKSLLLSGYLFDRWNFFYENDSRSEKWSEEERGKVRIVAASQHFNPRIFGVSHSALFCQAVRHLAGSAVGRGPGEGHWRMSRKEKDEPGTGLRKVRWEEQVAERDEVKWGRRKGVAAACLQILYRALQPPIRFPPVHQQLSRAHRRRRRRLRLHSPLERARMVWGRAAGGARQIRELHCQAGMIYLTNISI